MLLQPHRNLLKNKHRREHARIHLTWRLTDFRIMSLSLQIPPPPPPGRIEEGLERNAWVDIYIREGKGVNLSHSTPITILCLLIVTVGLWKEPFLPPSILWAPESGWCAADTGTFFKAEHLDRASKDSTARTVLAVCSAVFLGMKMFSLESPSNLSVLQNVLCWIWM